MHNILQRQSNDPTLHMGFIGVTTACSSIMKIFPEWARSLALPTEQLHGHDVPLDANPTVFRELIEHIIVDQTYLGALVTSHKISLYDAASDLFDEIDQFGRLCGEISSISKRGGRLLGHAKDPITAELAMREFLPKGYFADSEAEVLCLGSGGAAAAITWCLQDRPDPPARIVCTDISQARLDHLKALHRRNNSTSRLLSFVLAEDYADALLESLPPNSLVINATGMGKDRPGSPVTHTAHFPEAGVMWELNYRGSLEMLHHAYDQQDTRNLTVVDGWRYFIHGWTQVIAQVFDVEISTERVNKLSSIAASIVRRP